MNNRPAPTVRPVITHFDAVPDQLSCKCGAHLDRSGHLQERFDGTASVACLACGKVVANIAADIATYDTDPGPSDEKANDQPF